MTRPAQGKVARVKGKHHGVSRSDRLALAGEKGVEEGSRRDLLGARGLDDKVGVRRDVLPALGDEFADAPLHVPLREEDGRAGGTNVGGHMDEGVDGAGDVM